MLNRWVRRNVRTDRGENRLVRPLAVIRRNHRDPLRVPHRVHPRPLGVPVIDPLLVPHIQGNITFN